MKKLLYFLAQITWGLPQTLVGLVLFLINIKSRHYMYHGAVVTEWSSRSSISLGLFLFVTTDPIRDLRSTDTLPENEMHRALVVHEYGHTIQSLFLGPLYFPVIGIASAMWANLPRFVKRRRNGTPYSAFWTERSANMLGERVTRERSLQDVIF